MCLLLQRGSVTGLLCLLQRGSVTGLLCLLQRGSVTGLLCLLHRGSVTGLLCGEYSLAEHKNGVNLCVFHFREAV